MARERTDAAGKAPRPARRAGHALLACAALAAFAAARAPAADAPGGYFSPPRNRPAARASSFAPARAARLRAAGEAPARPARWDSRDCGWITPVKGQGDVGGCWAFAAFATLETQLLKSGRGEWDLSEKNLINRHGFLPAFSEGGTYDMAAACLLRWDGAVAEADDVYVKHPEYWTPSPALPPAVRVQDVVWTQPLDGTEERIGALKDAVMAYGAVAVSMRWDYVYDNTNGAYYCRKDGLVNHAVTVVGWDDAFPAADFRFLPPGDGAWIVKNSWGEKLGDAGYYYMSYHDILFGHEDYGTVFIPAPADCAYAAVRGYDRLGPCYDVSSEAATEETRAFFDLQAAVFTATWNEELAAVGVWTGDAPNPYAIEVYTNVTRGAASPVAGGVLALSQTGALEHAGYTTVALARPVPLAPGDAFAVVYRQTGEIRSTYVSCTIENYSVVEPARGDTYVGYAGAEGGADTWQDAVDAGVEALDPDGWAVCLKAYTRATAAVPAGDLPGTSDDGADMAADLAVKEPRLAAETLGSFCAAAGLVGANGRTRWASWLVGLDPAVPGENALTLSIDMAGGVPRLSWNPDLGAARTYTVWGRASLAPADAWTPVDTNALGAARFFRVSVSR